MRRRTKLILAVVTLLVLGGAAYAGRLNIGASMTHRNNIGASEGGAERQPVGWW